MRISVVSDVHGNFDALARIAEQAEKLLILGDLLDYVDYHDPRRGIIGEVFGVDAAIRFTRLRAAGDFRELRAFNASLWESLADPSAVLTCHVRERYEHVRQIIPSDTLITLGNVDVAEEWQAVMGDTVPYRDGEVVDVAGIRIGFVAGGARALTLPPPGTAPAPPVLGWQGWKPFVRSASDYRAAVERLGPTDVLCSHLPPDVAVLRYDVIPARLEMAGAGLIDHIRQHQPPLALFGHVHQPLAPRCRVGRTECVNVGHFQRSMSAWTFDLEWVANAQRTRHPELAERDR